MTEDKWLNIKSMVKDKFDSVEEKIEPIVRKIGLTDSQNIGQKEVLIFDSEIGKVKLEYLVKPVILEKKEHYSKRMGSSAQTQYILSDTEFTRRMDAYIWKNDGWEKIDSSSFIK